MRTTRNLISQVLLNIIGIYSSEEPNEAKEIQPISFLGSIKGPWSFLFARVLSLHFTRSTRTNNKKEREREKPCPTPHPPITPNLHDIIIAPLHVNLSHDLHIFLRAAEVFGCWWFKGVGKETVDGADQQFEAKRNVDLSSVAPSRCELIAESHGERTPQTTRICSWDMCHDYHH